MRALLVFLGLLMVLPGSAGADGLDDLVGTTITVEAVALDGDTLMIVGPADSPEIPRPAGTSPALKSGLVAGKTRIRLWGIYAPEMSAGGTPPPGWLALGELDEFLRANERVVTCDVVDIHKPSRGSPRLVARCRTKLGDLGRIMVAGGFATAYRLFTWRDPAAREEAEALDELQIQAVRERRGLWAQP